jgi:cell division protein FtsW (lipid II flippase)
MVITLGKRSLPLTIAALVAAGFGLLSIFSAGMVLFGPESAQKSAGAYAGFVVWFNFASGFAYVLAAYALWTMQRWSTWLALLITVAIALVSAGFGMHIASGAAYEMRTVAALGFRLAVWLAITLVAYVSVTRVR